MADWIVEKVDGNTVKLTAPPDVTIEDDVSIEDLLAALAIAIRYRSNGGDASRCTLVDSCGIDF
jgi:hypothetical protein